MNANIIKFFQKIKNDLKDHFYVMERFLLLSIRPSDLITTLTYILMNNFILVVSQIKIVTLSPLT